jgi:hypothetical protein
MSDLIHCESEIDARSQNALLFHSSERLLVYLDTERHLIRSTT